MSAEPRSFQNLPTHWLRSRDSSATPFSIRRQTADVPQQKSQSLKRGSRFVRRRILARALRSPQELSAVPLADSHTIETMGIVFAPTFLRNKFHLLLKCLSLMQPHD